MKNKINLTIFLVFLMILALVLVSIENQKQRQTLNSKAAEPESLPTQALDSASYVMKSPEGSKTLVLDRKLNLYSLNVIANSSQQKTEIITNEKGFTGLTIPFNTWSPDNVYFFLKEQTGPNIDYLVFQSNGSLFSNSLKFVSIGDLFKAKLPEYMIEDVTGWGGINLILINTKNTINNQKVSFWFDVPSQTFIQLSTYFK